MEKYKAIIFDLDGTMVDSMGIWKDIDVAYLAKYGYELPEDLQGDIEGMSFTETATYFKKRFAIEDELDLIKAEWNAMAYDHYTKKVATKADVKAFLELMSQQGLKMAIATSNSRELAEAVAKVHGFDEHIEVLVTSCDVKKGKPAPDVYLAAAKALGVDPKDCLVFEDTLAGVEGAKNAGMDVIAIHEDHAIFVDQIKEKADDYIYSYLELVRKEA